MCMKKYLFSIVFLISFSGFTQQVSMQKALSVAGEFILQNHLQCTVASVTPHIGVAGDTTYYIVNADPNHYVIVSASELVSPVPVWSNTSQFDGNRPFAQILESDIKNRIEKASLLTGAQKATIHQQWEQLSDGYFQSAKLQYWPDSGTTSTGGWVETHWTQSAPYNQMCPMDPVTVTRSYAGCPAIAMGQILNYLKTTQATRFDDSDDYYHNYSGRSYSIDDDADSLGFPTFPELNVWLDSVDILLQSGADATTQTAAAVVFACGTACVQVYTSTGSGTFSVNQAYAAYQRFNFMNCQLLTTADSAMYLALINNMKAGYPAHLAVMNAAETVGHNVVVDGYRADGYFHINFGWGGSNDGWWLVPDPSFPYSMGVLEGIVLDIIPMGVGIEPSDEMQNICVYPNPANDVIYLKNALGADFQYSIYSASGQLMQSGITSNSISVANWPEGIYFLQLQSASGFVVKKVVVE